MCFTPERLTVDVTMHVSRFCGLFWKTLPRDSKKSLLQPLGLKEMTLTSRFEGKTEMRTSIASNHPAVKSSNDWYVSSVFISVTRRVHAFAGRKQH